MRANPLKLVFIYTTKTQLGLPEKLQIFTKKVKRIFGNKILPNRKFFGIGCGGQKSTNQIIITIKELNRATDSSST